MIARYLQDALDNGTRFWDQTFSRILGPLIQIACNSRPGDIARSLDYTGNECLCWKDVELQVKDGNRDGMTQTPPTVDDLVLQLRLRFYKGKK
jgi:hypothetical protein